jgi:uncharacterized membrane protein YfcA
MNKIYILAPIFFLVSSLFSMLGMGGGIIYVPILLFAGYTMKEAPAISLILIAATSLAALTHFSKQKKVDWKLALVIDPPTNIMAFIGGYFCTLMPESILRAILIVILMIAGTLMLINSNKKRHPQQDVNHWWLWHIQFKGERYTVNLPLVLSTTALIGLLSGMLGITGGIIKLPVMVLLCGVPMDIAVATSTVMVAATALFGIVGHASRAPIDWKTALILAAAAVVGGLLGSRLSVSLDKSRLKKLFGIIVWTIAVKMAIGLLNH